MSAAISGASSSTFLKCLIKYSCLCFSCIKNETCHLLYFLFSSQQPPSPSRPLPHVWFIHANMSERARNFTNIALSLVELFDVICICVEEKTRADWNADPLAYSMVQVNCELHVTLALVSFQLAFSAAGIRLTRGKKNTLNPPQLWKYNFNQH